MNIPNILTTIRLFLIPVFILVFFLPIQNNIILAVFIFLMAGLTDILDGYIARKYNLITVYGTVLDPLADKLMLVTVLVCLVISKFIPFWILLVVSIKEFLMISTGIILYKNGKVIPSNIFGKISTLLFYLSIVVLVYNNNLGYRFLLIAILSSLIALINYVIIFSKSHQV